MSSDVRQAAARESLPRNYRLLLATLHELAPGRHLSAQEVHLRARGIQPKLGFATVHRGLARLHELGYVLKVDVPGTASAMYEPAVSPHAHFRCLTCGHISDVAFRVPADQIAALAAQLGFQIAIETTTFAGRCADCVTAGPPRSAEKFTDREHL